MTDQTIPADKVQELIEHFEGKDIGIESYGILGRFRALLPAQQPTTGLLGRWAKHPEHGDVVVISDHPGDLGDVWVSHTDTDEPDGATCDRVPLADLTFPHQATRPEDVPERPVSDLQAKYDKLEWEYNQALAEIAWLKAGNTPRIVTTPEEYDALPVGSQVQDAPGGYVWHKHPDGMWWTGGSDSKLHDSATRTVVRYGGGDEQPKPAWRIEHDPKNLRVGDYVIDADGDSGRIFKKTGSGYWCADSRLVIYPEFAPFIVFPNRPAATPEAVAEATEARDKEMGK